MPTNAYSKSLSKEEIVSLQLSMNSFKKRMGTYYKCLSGRCLPEESRELKKYIWSDGLILLNAIATIGLGSYVISHQVSKRHTHKPDGKGSEDTTKSNKTGSDNTGNKKESENNSKSKDNEQSKDENKKKNEPVKDPSENVEKAPGKFDIITKDLSATLAGEAKVSSDDKGIIIEYSTTMPKDLESIRDKIHSVVWDPDGKKGIQKNFYYLPLTIKFSDKKVGYIFNQGMRGTFTKEEITNI